MNVCHLGFENLPPAWGISKADKSLYSKQKSLTLESSQSQANFTHIVTDNGVADIWNNVYLPRLCFLTGQTSDTPVLFPGRTSALEHLLKVQNASYERYMSFSRLGLIRHSESLFLLADRSQGLRSWKWKSLLPDEMHQVTQIVLDEILEPLQFALPVTIDEHTVKQKFQEIRKAWSLTSSSDVYDGEGLALAVNYLSSFQSPEVWFELEEFVSYCTLRQSLNVVASGFHCDKWMDIAEAPIHNLRATERCSPARLIQELENLAVGRIAPLLVNEEGCVSDGNHRLVAAWVWKMLHACIDCQWRTGDIHFESALARFLEQNKTSRTQFALMNALESLSSILNSQESARPLEQLRKLIFNAVLETLPVVPMLAYSNFALDCTAFDTEGCFQRFSPGLYSELAANPAAFFSARACYHFGDRIALPWFSILKTNAIESITAQTSQQISKC